MAAVIPLSARQVADLGEAMAGALDMAAISPAGSREQMDAITAARERYKQLAPYLLTEAEQAGLPAMDTVHKD